MTISYSITNRQCKTLSRIIIHSCNKLADWSRCMEMSFVAYLQTNLSNLGDKTSVNVALYRFIQCNTKTKLINKTYGNNFLLIFLFKLDVYFYTPVFVNIRNRHCHTRWAKKISSKLSKYWSILQIYISQGSVATKLRCGGIFVICYSNKRTFNW